MASREPEQAERRTRLDSRDLRELGIADAPHVEWDELRDMLDEQWQAGQHVSIFAPTEGGKTHLIRYGLLPLWTRYPVMWVRFKPRDETTEGWGVKVQRFPVAERLKYRLRGRDSAKWESDPEHYLLQLPAYRHQSGARDGKTESWSRARDICAEVLDRSYREGGWVLVIDEVRALSDRNPPHLDLGAYLENCWQRGRSQPLTVIAAAQQPAWAPTSMYDQPRFVFLGRVLDEARFERIGEMGGNSKEIEQIIPTLRGAGDPEGPEFLVVDRWSGEMWVTVAPSGPGR